MTITTYTDREIALKTERDNLRQQLSESQSEVARLEQDRDEWKDSTISANANASSEEKRRRAMQDERDTIRQQLAAAMQLAQLNGKIAAELKADKLALEAAIEASRKQEPVYAFRRKGLDDFCTCSEKRFLELSSKQNLFEVKKLYATPVVALDALKLHKKHMEQLVESGLLILVEGMEENT